MKIQYGEIEVFLKGFTYTYVFRGVQNSTLRILNWCLPIQYERTNVVDGFLYLEIFGMVLYKNVMSFAYLNILFHFPFCWKLVLFPQTYIMQLLRQIQYDMLNYFDLLVYIEN